MSLMRPFKGPLVRLCKGPYIRCLEPVINDRIFKVAASSNSQTCLLFICLSLCFLYSALSQRPVGVIKPWHCTLAEFCSILCCYAVLVRPGLRARMAMLETLLHQGRADETNRKMTHAMVNLMLSESLPCPPATFVEGRWRRRLSPDVCHKATP